MVSIRRMDVYLSQHSSDATQFSMRFVFEKPIDEPAGQAPKTAAPTAAAAAETYR